MRIRDFGLSMGTLPTGKYNAITDVKNVKVGHSTVIKDSADEIFGIVRSGVTAIIPTEDIVTNPIYAGYYSLNGNGELCGSHWIEESGLLQTPICLTNTHSLGLVRDAIIQYYYEKLDVLSDYWMLPVVAETWDGWLSDINGMHIKKEHVYEALDNAKSEYVTEGCVGGGTGMILHEFKGGIGSSSRIVNIHNEKYTVGALIQGNYGRREDLVIDNIPIGKFISTDEIIGKSGQKKQGGVNVDGSIIIVVATDAPLLPDQCKRLSRRAALGLARCGSFASDSSGDIFITFSTANKPHQHDDGKNIAEVKTLKHDDMDQLFLATVEAVHESIANALCAAKTTKGILGRSMFALPHDRLKEIIRRFQ